MSVIANVVDLSTSEMRRLADEVRIRLIPQLIKGISRVFQRLFKYFNGTAICTFTILALLILFHNLGLNLNDSDSAIKALFNGGSSLQNWCKLPDVFE